MFEKGYNKARMNPGPRLKFQLNIEFDRWTCNNDVFHNSVIKDHPMLTESTDLEPEAKKAFNDRYVEKYYKTHKKDLEDAEEKMKDDWMTIESGYFEATDKLFNSRWPEGRYICYPSIFNCNPRFIGTKEFQVFYKHPETTNYVCAHEMLHFIFYDYIEKHYNQKYKRLEEKVIWKLSEIFNDVVLRLPEFIAITGQKDPGIYAETRDELNDAIKLWENTKTVGAFVTKYLVLFSNPVYNFPNN